MTLQIKRRKLPGATREDFFVRDHDIRESLKERLKSIFGNEEDTLIIDELGLCKGNVRVDIAVVNGTLNGYEIKSERDTLERLPYQKEVYNKTLDTITIVASGCHLEKIMTQIPNWWGVTEACAMKGRIQFNVLRNPMNNPSIDPLSLVQLLWRNETLALLIERGLAKGVRTKPRNILWRKLADNVPLEELRKEIRKCLKSREKWPTAR